MIEQHTAFPAPQLSIAVRPKKCGALPHCFAVGSKTSSANFQISILLPKMSTWHLHAQKFGLKQIGFDLKSGSLWMWCGPLVRVLSRKIIITRCGKQLLTVAMSWFQIEDELNRKLDPLNVTAYVTGPEIVKATPEPSSTRFRRASTVSFTVHYIIKLFSLFPESIPKNSEINTLIEALTNTSQAVSPGFFVAPQRITLIPYDYCVYGAHNCDVRTTICVFDDLSAKISCPCLPYHTSVDQRSCVFNSSVSGELLNGILKNNNGKNI